MSYIVIIKQIETQCRGNFLSHPHIIKELIDSLNIQQISLPGYEADDLIGTLSKKAEKEGFTTYDYSR